MEVDKDPEKMDAFQNIEELAEKLRSMSKEEQAAYLKSMGIGGDDSVNETSSGLDFSQIYPYLFFITCLSVITLIIVFFGYKLYRSLTEKERKRDEKRKQKQMKKKK